jgi:DNA-binding GntR family transcriptional regulator
MENEENKQKLKKLNALNLRDRVERELRTAILSGVFQPGQKLVEYDIAEQLEVSRAPVREALTALQKDGLVVDIFRRGYFVPVFNETDIHEIYEVRTLLEVGGLRMAYPKLTEVEFDHLQAIIDTLGDYLTNSEKKNAVPDVDIEFHEYLMSLANNKRLYSAWKSIKIQSQLLIGITSRTDYEYLEEPKTIHQNLLNAIRYKDLAEAEKALEHHLLDAKERAIKNLQKKNDLVH